MLSQKILAAAGQGAEPIYVDDVMSTWLYTGNGSTQTITNGIDLAGKGGLVWIKSRSATTNNFLFDTSRGVLNEINSNTTDAQASLSGSLTSFNSNGFSLGSAAGINVSAATYASWTFREAEKFFDVVTYTGNSVYGRAIPHSLGSTPGCVIVKAISGTNAGSQNWGVWHRSLADDQNLNLNTTAAAAAGNVFRFFAPADSTNFYVTDSAASNQTGHTYVAYLFAHNAGGFGATGNDNVISCGSYTGNASSNGPVINLGYEPQWILIKNAGASQDWVIVDVMRGIPVGGEINVLFPNLSSAETATSQGGIALGPTSFQIRNTTSLLNSNGVTYIYIAIRRPMKPPTSGTQVFSPVAYIGNGASDRLITTGFSVDATLQLLRDGNGQFFAPRLTSAQIRTSQPAVEGGAFNGRYWTSNTAVNVGATGNDNGFSRCLLSFRRAPGFFDIVCYTGTGNGQVINHNLGAVPELAIFKLRAGASNVDWFVRPPGTVTDRFLLLNTTDAQSTAANWYSATSTQITFPTSYGGTAASGFTYVAYLFASLPGISQVGTYTGNGSSQTINCGFAAGARFVMIKRVDSTGNWFVWDSARGINPAGTNDPYLALNSTAAEVTNNDSLSAQSVGFGVIQNATTDINVNGASYVYLSIA